VIVAVALAVAALAAVGVLVLGSQRSASRSPASKGEAIFQSGIAANGNLIPRTGSGGMMGGGGMMRAGCATCHGSDGHGRSTPTFTSPNITYSNLTDPQGMLQPARIMPPPPIIPPLAVRGIRLPLAAIPD